MDAQEEIDRSYVYLPAATGGGAIARRDQIVGARPNGQDGSIVYLASGPSLYVALTTAQLASVVRADMIDPRGR